MTLGALVAIGLGGCGFILLAAGLGLWQWRRTRTEERPHRRREDPDRAQRDADRRQQQRLLAVLSRDVGPRTGSAGRWSPRATNPVSGRAVLLFDGWRPLNEDGTRRTRRRGPEALMVGHAWPFILSVDLTGLSGPEAARVTEEIIALVRTIPGARVRLVVEAAHGRVEEIVAAAECRWSAGEDTIDLTTDGAPI